MGQSDWADVLAGAVVSGGVVSSASSLSATVLLCLLAGFWVAVRHAGAGRPRCPGPVLLAAWATAVLGSAGLLTFLLRALPVDVGVELLEPLADAPVLCVRGADGAETRLGEMEAIPERFGLNVRPQIDIRASRRRNPESRAKEIWVEPSDGLDQWWFYPTQAWKTGIAGRTGTSGDVEAGVRGQALLARDTEVGLLKAPWAGIAKVRTAEGEREIDLYAPQMEMTYVKVSAANRSLLYYGRVPRAALRGLALRFAPDAAPQVGRVYIGTLLPTIASPATSLPNVGWGRLRLGWPATPDGGVLAIPRLPAWELGGGATFALMAALAAVVLGVGGGLALDAARALARLRRAPLPDLPVAAFRWRRLAAFWAPVFLYWTLWLLVFYPGMLNSDGVDQWNQAKTGVYCDHHPAVLAIGMAWLTRVWDSPAIVALVQVFVLSLTVALAADVLWRLGVRRAVVVAAYAVVALSPKNSNLAVSLIKDVPFAAAVLGASVLLAALLASEPLRRRVWPWVALGLVLASCRLVRHNGSLVLFAVLVAMVPAFGRERLGRVALTAAVAVATVLAVRVGLYRAEGVPPYDFNAGLMAELTRVGAVVDQRAPLAPNEIEFLDRTRSLDDGWDYDVVSMGGFFYTPEYPLKWEYVLRRRAEFDRLFLSLTARNAAVVLRHSVRNLDYLFAPVAHEKTAVQGLMWQTTDVSPKARQWGLRTAPVLPGLYRAALPVLFASDRPAWNWLFWRPALSVYACILALTVLLWRTRDWRAALVFLPALLVLPSLVMAFVQTVRFVLPVSLAAPFLICLALAPWRAAAGSDADAQPNGESPTDDVGPRVQ